MKNSALMALSAMAQMGMGTGKGFLNMSGKPGVGRKNVHRRYGYNWGKKKRESYDKLLDEMKFDGPTALDIVENHKGQPQAHHRTMDQLLEG